MTLESLTGSEMDLEGLWDVEATFHFTDPNDLRRTLRAFFNDAMDRDSLSDHTVLVTGFPAESFIIDDDADEEPIIPRGSKTLYFENSKGIFVTMPGPPHEIVSRMFFRQLDGTLRDMNCLDDIVPTGGAERAMVNVNKQPDESWRPSGVKYITCALEAGVSESDRTLHHDAKIWLEHPDSHVTQVITIKISRTRPEIVFSVWKIAAEERDTQAQHPPRAIVDHGVRAILADNRPVADGRIRLSFEDFFERRPRSGTAEKDIVFSAREIGGIARVVWGEMGFLPQQ